MNYKMDALDKALAQQQMIQQGKEIREAQQAARKKPPGKVDIPDGTPDSVAKQMKFAAGFSAPEPEPTIGKVDHAAPTREKFAAGFSGDETARPTLLDQLMAYGERQAAQNTPMPPEQAHAAVAEPSPQARRADESGTPQGQPGTPEQLPLPLPLTTTALFSQLEQQVNSLVTDPAMPVDVKLRRGFKNLGGEAREAIVAKIEAEDYGAQGWLSKYNPDYQNVLISDALCRRLADARRLDPEITAERLLEMMVAATQG